MYTAPEMKRMCIHGCILFKEEGSVEGAGIKPGNSVGGFYYEVTDEQLEAYASLSPLQRLQWVEEARIFTLLGQTPETARWHALLRAGNAGGR